MSKQTAVKQLTEMLRQQLADMTEAAKTTHEAATGEESKQEGKYDTRGLEASYLAGAQAEQTRKIAESLKTFETLKLDDFTIESSISPGALVETESNGQITYYLLTPCAGGMNLTFRDGTLITLSPEAPRYKELLGCHVGDFIEDNNIIILDIS